jgi:hypothetical protein
MTGTELEAVEKPSISIQMLLDWADYSPNEISKKTGFAPIEVARRLIDFLDDSDGWLTLRQKELVLIHQMQEVLRDARKRLPHASDEDYAPILNAVVRGMKTIGERFDAMRKAIEIDIHEITLAQSRIYGQSYNHAWDIGMELLMENHPDITDDEIRAAKKAGMIAAKKKLEESVSSDG